MVLTQDLLTPSELSYVINEIKDCPNFEETNVNQFLEPLDMYDPTNAYDSDQADNKFNIKKQRLEDMCDSTIQASSTRCELLPITEPFTGKFNFQLQLPTDSAVHKWIFSKLLNKVFIDIDKVLALQFKWNFYELKQDVQLFIRALPVYTSHDWLSTPVNRCPLHIIPDNSYNKDFPYVEHVIRCEHSGTRYTCDSYKRYSCVTPLNYPQPGSETTTLTYKFVCKTSCSSGMDRRPISVIFTLEDVNGKVYGRQLLPVKICSCPKRDKEKEEMNELEKHQSSASHVSTKIINASPSFNVESRMSSSVNNVDTLRDLRLSSKSVSSKLSKKKFRSHGKRGRTQGNRNLTREVFEEFAQKSYELMQKLIYKSENSMNDDEFSEFGKLIAAQLREVPLEKAIQLQVDIQKLISENRLQTVRQGMHIINDCLTPEPSLASPGSPSE